METKKPRSERSSYKKTKQKRTIDTQLEMEKEIVKETIKYERKPRKL